MSLFLLLPPSRFYRQVLIPLKVNSHFCCFRSRLLNPDWGLGSAVSILMPFHAQKNASGGHRRTLGGTGWDDPPRKLRWRGQKCLSRHVSAKSTFKVHNFLFAIVNRLNDITTISLRLLEGKRTANRENPHQMSEKRRQLKPCFLRTKSSFTLT